MILIIIANYSILPRPPLIPWNLSLQFSNYPPIPYLAIKTKDHMFCLAFKLNIFCKYLHCRQIEWEYNWLQAEILNSDIKSRLSIHI